MFYKDPDHHAVLCAQTMEVGEGGVEGARAFLLLFFLSLPKPFPSNPSTAAHIQLLAIIRVDPLHSLNGMWVSKDFLFVPNSPMLQTGSREEVRSQLPGDRDWEWSGCDSFSIQQSQSKANVGWEAGRRTPQPPPQPHQGLLPYCLPGGLRASECWWCGRGEGEEAARGGRPVR